MDPENINGIYFNFNGNDIYIHDSVFNSWLIVIALSLFALYVNKKAKSVNVKDKPSGLMNVMEFLIDSLDNLVKTSMGEKNIRYAPLIATLAFYLIAANSIGLLGLTPPTSDYNVTLALALVSAFSIQAMGVRSSGWKGYLKGFLEPYPFLLPINVIGEIATPVSLSFRLFGNILSGAIIMAIIYSFTGFLAPVVTPVLHAYFDVIAGLLQTFIFCMLTMVFIAMAE